MSPGELDKYIIARRENIPLKNVLPDPNNVRLRYSRENIRTLAHSIANNGQLQAVLVEKINDNEYQLIAGHRRRLACEFAHQTGLTDRDYLVAKVVRPLPEDFRLRLQRAENDYKAQVAKCRLADVFWRGYKPTLIQNTEGLSEREIEIIHNVKHFWELPPNMRENLSIDNYAEIIGYGKKAVRTAFLYQTLHGDIKRRVSEGKLSYAAACELAQIKSKKEQLLLLSNLKKEKKTKNYLRTCVGRYLTQKKLEDETGNFMRGEEDYLGRFQDLKDLSLCINKAERAVKILNSIREFASEINDLEGIIGNIGSSEEIVNEVYVGLKDVHDKLLKDPKYKHRWEFVPKRSSLEEFILSNVSKDKSNVETVMDCVESKVVSVDLIDPNPYNPRGESREFDEDDIEKLTKSIDEDGLINDVLVMKGIDGRYVNLEGHRRHVALKRLGASEVGVLILPPLTKDQQIKVMCDADLFEEISVGARANAIARQYLLDKKAADGNLTVDEFVKNHKSEWSGRVIRDSISYCGLPDAVKIMHMRGLIPYGAAVGIAGSGDENIQRELAVSAAIMEQSRSDVIEYLKEDETGSLFDEAELDQISREGVLKKLNDALAENLNGINIRMNGYINDDISKFLEDDISVIKFQRLMKALGSAV